MDLRPGSILRADGGYLIIYALDALGESGVWRTLKRTLNHAKLDSQPLEIFFPFGTSAIKPEPIDIDVKIILIGDPTCTNPVRKRRRLPKDFQSARGIRRGNGMSDAVIRQYGGRLRSFRTGRYRSIRSHRRRQHAGIRRAPGRAPKQSYGAVSGSGGSSARGAYMRAGRGDPWSALLTCGARARRVSSVTT